MMMSKKYIAVLMAGAMAAAGVPMVACAENSEKVDITVMCAYASEDPHGQYVYQYAEEFMEANPGINVEIQAVSSNDIHTKLAAMVASPDDLPTVFWVGAGSAPTLDDLGLMEDLNAYLDEDALASFANGVLDACSVEDRLVVYPIAVQPSAILYRTDRFAEAGLEIPETWEEFLACAKALTKDSDGDGEVDQWGFSMVGANNGSGQSRYLAYLYSNGCDVVSYDEDNEEWTADLGDDFTGLLKFWTDMNNVDEVVPTGITEVDYATAANYFAMGYTSMMLTGSNAIGVAYASNPELKGNIGSFPIPGTAPGTMINAEGYGICSYASDEEKAAAIEFLNFFANNDEEKMFWQSSGKIPATVEGQKAEYISGDDYKGYLETIAAGCHEALSFPGSNAMCSLLGDAYSAVFSGEKTCEEAVADFETAFDELLEDYN